MQKILSFICLIIVSNIVLAQVPNAIPYQAIVRTNAGTVISNQAVKLRFSIRDSIALGSIVYQETHNTTTTAQGLVTVQIGQGIISQGLFANINWGKNNKFIQTEVDITGGTTYKDFGTTQFMSVPYAKYAESAGNIVGTAVLPTLLTTSFNNINYTSATISANLVSSGGKLISAKGICINTTPNAEDNSILASNNATGSYSVIASNLIPNTTYYARAFATSIAGTAFGKDSSFKTLALTTATVNTQAVSNISNTTALATGNIVNNGGTTLTDRGFCWSLTTNPTTANSRVSLGSGVDTFNATITALTQATTYYVRAYAINAQGTSYGNNQVFTTITMPLATITTTAASDVSYTAAISGGNVTNDGGSTVTQRGICYHTSTNPTTANTVILAGTGVGIFSSSLAGLNANTTYYVRAFATNAGGTVYGSQITFTTLAITTATVSTTSVYAISTTSAASGGNVSNDGGATVTQRGVCWSATTNPTLLNNYTTDGTGTGIFNSAITGLSLNTTYYVRAYATNNNGTVYGSQVSFSTLTTLPSGNSIPLIGTIPPTKTDTSYLSGGYIGSEGGATIQQQGICWSKNNTNPTVLDSIKYYLPTGLGYYAVEFVLPSTCYETYYIRAFAKNTSGVGYGAANTVYTGLTPKFTTSNVTNIGSGTAVCGATITVDGGCGITERGVCWGANSNPTIFNNKCNNGIGIGSFSCTLTNLLANLTYYTRSYVIINGQEYYGDEKVFTMPPATTGLQIGQTYAGGIIFYIDSTGQHGLVCAPTDQGTSQWGCTGTNINTPFKNLGGGANNTVAIIAGCTNPNIAAKMCASLVLNGYADWYLPNMTELSKMRVNLFDNNLGNFKTGVWLWEEPYWSSNQEDEVTGTVYMFMVSAPIIQVWGNGKDITSYNVRAVRKF